MEKVFGKIIGNLETAKLFHKGYTMFFLTFSYIILNYFKVNWRKISSKPISSDFNPNRVNELSFAKS